MNRKNTAGKLNEKTFSMFVRYKLSNKNKYVERNVEEEKQKKK